MIIDMRVYRYLPSGFADFLASYAQYGQPVTARHLGTTVGMFFSASGVANRTLQMFAYENSDHRDACRSALRSDSQWLDFIREASQHIVEQTNIILRPTDFSALKEYTQLANPAAFASDFIEGMLFELRTYTAHPGRLPEALELLRNEGCPLTHQYVERPVAYFTSETGVSNQVRMLWAYRNDGERDRRRDKMRADSQYRELGARFNPLFAHQEGDLWLPVPHSPMR